MTDEIWKIIKNYEDYQISNLGRVKSLKFGKEKLLKLTKVSNGYLQVVLYKDGKRKSKLIHNLEYEIFNNYKLKKNECVHHKDENKIYNYIDNLEKRDIIEHSIYHNKGRTLSEDIKMKISNNHDDRRGEKCPIHILISQDVIQIKLLLKNNKLTQQEIADIFEVNYRTISYIKLNKRWSHIGI